MFKPCPAGGEREREREGEEREREIELKQEGFTSNIELRQHQ